MDELSVSVVMHEQFVTLVYLRLQDLKYHCPLRLIRHYYLFCTNSAK